jgi:hypothetical protein
MNLSLWTSHMYISALPTTVCGDQPKVVACMQKGEADFVSHCT